MTCNSLTSSDESYNIGAVADQVLGVPLQFDTYTDNDGTLMPLLTTTLRHYQFDPENVAWVDHTGTANLSGTTTAKASGATMWDATDLNVFVVTTKADRVKVRKSATDNLDNLSSSLGAGYFARIFRPFGFRGNLYNIIDTGVEYAARHQWSSQNQVGDGDWNTSTDYDDLVEFPGAIVAVEAMRDALLIYKERSAIIAQGYNRGAASPLWLYRTLYTGAFGIEAPLTLRGLADGRHMYLGPGDVFMFDGSNLVGVAKKVFNDIIDNISTTNIQNSWAQYLQHRNEYRLWFPTTEQTHPGVFWTYNIATGAWFGPSQPSATGLEFALGGIVAETSNITWDEITATWDSYDFAWDTTTTEFPIDLVLAASGEVYRTNAAVATWDGTDIDVTLDVPNIFQSDTAGARVVSRFQEVELEATIGTGSTLTLYTSTDDGGTWTSQSTPVSPTYDSTVRRYKWYPDLMSDNLMLRFIKTGTATTAKLIRCQVKAIPMENI